MKLKKSEKMLTSLAGLAVIFMVLNKTVCSGEKHLDVPKTQQTQPVPIPSQTSDNKKLDSKPPRIRKQRIPSQRVEFQTWGRDPFAEAFRLAKFDTSGRDSSRFVLKGVIRRGKDAYVLIGDEILKEGEQRGDLVVMDIGENRVVCKKRGRLVTLILNREDGS
ncbi:MAG: hypothetical protein ACE5IR_07360 [bacterium]